MAHAVLVVRSPMLPVWDDGSCKILKTMMMESPIWCFWGPRTFCCLSKWGCIFHSRASSSTPACSASEVLGPRVAFWILSTSWLKLSATKFLRVCVCRDAVNVIACTRPNFVHRKPYRLSCPPCLIAVSHVVLSVLGAAMPCAEQFESSPKPSLGRSMNLV